MSSRSFIAVLVAGLALGAFAEPAAAQTAPSPPVATKIPVVSTLHGDRRVDDYAWLRGKDKPEVLDYLKAENAYTTAMMKPTEALQQKLYDEMLGHIKQTDLSVPFKRGDYYYYTRTEAGKQYSVYARKRGSLAAPEEVLLDANALAVGKKYFALGSLAVSDDGNKLAYTFDETGYRQYTLAVKDLRTGTTLPDRAERVDEVVWASDDATLFYVTEDAVSKRNDTLWRRRLGTDSVQVYREPDELYDIGVSRSSDRRYVFLTAASKTDDDVRYADASRPADPLKTIVPRRADLRYFADHREGRFYIRTNLAAPNFRIVSAPDDAPGATDRWADVIAYRPAVNVSGYDVHRDFMVVSERENGLDQLEVLDFGTGTRHRVSFDEPAYAVFGNANPEYAQRTWRFSYQSPVTPSTVIEYDPFARTRQVLKQTEVPGYDRARYVVDRVFATASDGTQIPLTVTRRRDTPLDGTAPALLYGYGSYGITIPDTFSATRLVLLDRGVVYVTAHIRGGGELGEPWRDAGRMMSKRTTFTDFIAAGEHLGNARIAAKDKIVIQGGSAGGLLVGAALNLRPDLWRAAIAQVPFVDVLNTMLDASLPLTTSEYREWGNPNEAAAYAYMRTYSPYDNIAARAYPDVLVEVSLNDSQVPYWEGTKFAARLRALTTSGKPVLLKANLEAGHGGASGRYDALHEAAFNDAYVLSRVGIDR
ncbi:MAG: S9 family peptidase [Candidatus Eremiobacteraeota bacterium]|nr:S9 family peptidase [Candidatus Eremiobacteraeota bacterium]